MLTIGADPELFLKQPDGKFISAIGKFGGTKEKPRQMFGMPGFFVQEDNVAVEFNIPPVQLGLKGVFADVINQALVQIEKEARAKSLELAIIASAEFDSDQLRSPKARHFGCDPDFNAWSLRVNPSPKAKNKKLRSAGGHIHVGGDDVKDKIGLIRAMDLFVGCPSIVHDPDRARRELYGKAGAMRDKPYGVEYRTVSNFWIKSKELSEMVHDQVCQAVAFIRNDSTIPNDDAKKVIQCINNSDQDLLRELTKKYGLRY